MTFILRFLILSLMGIQGAVARVDSIEIIKHRHELNLIKDDKVLKTYKVSLGRQSVGRKMDKDDKRTPEGHYEIRRKLLATDYHKSLILNYPTPEEKADADARGINIGDHLCIHGIRSYLQYMPYFMQKLHRWIDWTAGCVAMANNEIDEIFEEVEEGTPVVIYE
ncbi:L,D-transpeptidase family protein [Candidatus Odyssella acanthamoebae]|uniref:L,D-transpeptidase family protein n=1 Tax=Candidatus Odyssella acanthamoebae TaxID=91604 RepID=UPI00068FB982|nr:L,D-transpeptidase [Candidatus Paracaedibacter acanthamoebae]